MKRKRRKIKKLTWAQRSRKAFEKAARIRFSLTASQAKELRKRFEDRTGTASAAELRRHPRIAAKIVPAAKAAVKRIGKKRALKAKGKAAINTGARPVAREVPVFEIAPEKDTEEAIEEAEEIFEEEATLEIEGGEDEY